jgi:hypothetical protein
MQENKETETNGGKPLQIRLPGFIAEEDIGLGDVVKRVTYSLGIKACGGCEQRAATLNRWISFTGNSK